MTTPKYREDTKGNLAAFKADCVDSMRGEIARSEDFIFHAEDCSESWQEWGVYLTPQEMRACFKLATR